MGLFTEWLKGPVDNSLEGIKARILGEALSPEERAARRAEIADRKAAMADYNQIGQEAAPTPAAPVATPKQVGRMRRTPQAAPQPKVQELPTPPAPQQELPMPPAPSGPYEAPENIQAMLGELTAHLGQGRKTKAKQRILDRLQHPVAGERIGKFLEAMIDQDKRGREQWNDLSTFSDEEGAMRFLTEGMGFVVGKDGRLSQGAPNRELRALGGAGMPGEGRGEPRGIGYREIQALLDPTRRAMLEDAQDDETGMGARAIHKMALKNDIPWELAEKLYDRFDRSTQGKLDGWGKPEAAQGTFNPLGPVEFLKDAEGNFTGETNIDALARTDIDEYNKHFDQSSGNRGRGIFNLMKHLSQGGQGEFTGLPSFFDFDTQTPDHIMGRSSGEMPGGRAKDDPLNLAFERRGLNQFKVSSQADGERDTLKSMLNAAQGVKGPLGAVEYDGEDVDDMGGAPNIMKYLAYRLGQSDFDPDKIASRLGEGGLDRYPDTIEELMGLDDDAIKGLVTASGGNNPLGLNLRNMAMRAPRPDQRPLVANSWSGAPGGGLEYTPLTGYRRAMLANALFDPGIQSQLQEYEAGLNPKWSDEKKEKAVMKKRRDLVEYNLFGPQKAAGSLYGLGQLGTGDYIDRLKELAGGKLGFLQESNPEVHQQLMDAMGETLDGYRGDLDGKLPDGPFRVSDEDMGANMDTPYMKAIMSSNYGRSKMPPALVKLFDEQIGTKGEFYEDLNDGKLDLSSKYGV